MRTNLALGLIVVACLATALQRLQWNARALVKDQTSASQSSRLGSGNSRLARRFALSATRPSQNAEEALVAAAEQEADPDRRSETLGVAAASVSDAELPATLEALVLDARPAAAELSQILVRRWAEADAPTAAAWISQLPEGPSCQSSFGQVAIAWANSDLPAATAWVQAMPAGECKTTAALGLGYEASRVEPITALELAGALPSGPQRDDLLVHAISQWAVGDSARAADWAAQVPDATLRQRLLAAVLVAAAEKDGAAAAAFAVQALPPGEDQDQAAVCIVQRWAQYSPAAAASWIEQWPDNPIRAAAEQSLGMLPTIPHGDTAR
jgi:hypothetical protein